MGKKVIVVDLNPLSRSARTATVTIVDNIVRAVPNMTAMAKEMKDQSPAALEDIIKAFHNEKVLAQALDEMMDYVKNAK
jgi:4-phosphopantoate--beta-alanine ligase